MPSLVRFTLKFCFALLITFLGANHSRVNAAESPTVYHVYLPLITRQTDAALTQFAMAVANGEAAVVRGVYALHTMALPVEQQPADSPMYVGDTPETTTQFRLAEVFSVVGLLAHNTLAGAHFSHLPMGQVLHLAYGDGSTRAFRIVEIKHYRTADGTTFIAPDTVGTLSAAGVFMQVYTRPGTLVLQTCLEFPGDVFLGVMFIIAEPVED